MPRIHEIPIIATWKRLGGSGLQGRPPHFRGRAHWRDGDGFNIAIDTDKNCYFDHRDGEGGGVLKLVEVALCCDQAEALHWLSNNCGLEDRHATPAGRANARRQQWEAEQFEEELQGDYRAFLHELERRRDQLILLLRRGEDSGLELELEILYSRIDNMRRAIGDHVEPWAVEFTIAIVDMIAEAHEEKKDAEDAARKHFAAGQRTKITGTTARVNVNKFPPSIETLNAMEPFDGWIRFQSFSRRGSMILATTCENQQIIWPTMTDLTSFARARAAIAEGSDVLLPQPPRNQIAKVWDPAARMIIRLAAQDSIRVEHTLKAECKDLLLLMWRYAKQPQAEDSKGFMEYLILISRAVRDRERPAPPCVFIAEESVWVHVPTFRNWISMPALTNRLYPLADIRQGLLLLGFEYQKDVTRGHEGESESASLWRGPVDVLLE